MNEKKQAWTPEPWEVQDAGRKGINIVKRDSQTGFIMCTLFTVGNEANAARIVACVNAMEGIENPEEVKELVKEVKLIVECGEEDELDTYEVVKNLSALLSMLGVK